MPAALAIGSIALTAYSGYKQKQSADNAAAVDTATADYNSRLDITQAQQLDLDTQQNIRTQRAEDAAYLSRQEASYASAGVLANTGSALDAQITNAGRMEQRIQQQWVDSNQRQQQYYSAAKMGRLEGAARATSDKMQGNIALINGGAKIAGQVYSGYQSGVFGGG